MVSFSTSAYWKGIDEYYKNIYNENETTCKIASYIKQYVTYLKTFGVSIKESRLLTRQELLNNFRCTGVECKSAPNFIVETSYWLGEAYGIDSNRVWASTTSKTLVNRDYYHDTGYGVCLVIII